MSIATGRAGGNGAPSKRTWSARHIAERICGGLTIEDGIALFIARYDLSAQSDTVKHIVRALGHLDDIEEDDSLPIDKAALARWWGERQVRLVRQLGRNAP